MDLSSALSYPFKSIPKVLTIALVCTISFVVFIAMLINSYDWTAYFEALNNYSSYGYMAPLDSPGSGFIPSIIGLFAVMILQGVWLSGYGISVIRHVMEGFEALPKIDFWRNLRDGLSVVLASLLYGFVTFLFFFALLMGMGMFMSPQVAALSFLVVIASMVITVVFVCLLGWSFLIGMARFAAYDDNNAIYQIVTNFGIARQNWKSSFSLMGYQILLGIIFWFASQAINTGLQFTTIPFFGNSVNANSMLTVMVIFMVVSYTINIFQQFSSLHLVAQFGHKIGIMPGYEDEFDTF